MRITCLLTLLAVAAPTTAFADIAEGVNSIRQRGCAGERGVNALLRPDRGLDDVARQWSRGGRLRDALARSDYRAVNSSSMHVGGSPDERKMLAVLEENYCEAILNPQFSEIGVHRKADDVWIVLAAPFSPPDVKDVATVSEEVLRRVNQARSQPRKCGRKAFPAVQPLTLSPALSRAALAHARDMAAHSLFEHQGSDGSQPAQRVSKAGYQWSAVGENIAAGAPDAKSVVQGWLESPGHCATLMDTRYTEMGLAYAVDRKSKAGIYWAQVFARPR